MSWFTNILERTNMAANLIRLTVRMLEKVIDIFEKVGSSYSMRKKKSHIKYCKVLLVKNDVVAD